MSPSLYICTAGGLTLSSRKISVQNQYMAEKVLFFLGDFTKIKVHVLLAMQVGNCVFVSDDGIRDMAREMEEIYATVFGTQLHLFCAYFLRSHDMLNIPASGDKKKACKELRARTTVESHHFSTFRSGLLAGFSISALIDGLWRG